MITGGNAINETTIVSRLGRHTALMGRIGSDAAGYFIVDHCHRENIDIKSPKQDADIDTSISVGLVIADGECIFVTNRSGSLWKLNTNDVNSDRFSQARLLSPANIFDSPLLDGDVLATIFTQTRAHKLIICADTIRPRLNRTLDDIHETLSYVDYLFPNFEEAKLPTGKNALDEIADSFPNCGVKTVVIKTDKGGCFVRCVDMKMVVPTMSEVTTIDTIGAGDSFASGFISVLLEGKPLRDCALFANAMAAVSVLDVSATADVKSRKPVEQLLDKYGG